MSEYYLVDIENIKSDTPRSAFEVKELEKVARNIVAVGGLLSPILLRQESIEAYSVVLGDFEYYAAVRAQELFPEEIETISAFIIQDEFVKDSIEQLNILGKARDRGILRQKNGNKSINSGQISNLEDRLNEFMHDFREMQTRSMKDIEHRISDLQEQLPSKVEALELFNQAKDYELSERMAKANIKGKTAKKIIGSIKEERSDRPFSSLKDVVTRVSGLGDRGMLTLLDSLSSM